MKVKKLKAYRGEGKILITISKELAKKLPNYFFIDLDLNTIEEREKENYAADNAHWQRRKELLKRAKRNEN